MELTWPVFILKANSSHEPARFMLFELQVHIGLAVQITIGFRINSTKASSSLQKENKSLVGHCDPS